MDCGKASYQTERRAREIINSFHKKYKGRERSSKHEIPTRTYFCKNCGYWHLTSLNLKVKRDPNLGNTSYKA